MDQQERRYYIDGPQPVAKRELHPLAHAAIRLAILYVVVYAVCFTMEGVMRLHYGVGSVTEIEERFKDRGQRAKALVARQKKIDAMTEDWRYDVYLAAMFFGTPIAMVLLIRHDIRLLNRLMGKVWKPVRWWAIGMLLLIGNGLTVFIGPFVKAEHFYDRTSPAELIKKLK